MLSVLTPGRRRQRRTPLVVAGMLALAAAVAGAAAGHWSRRAVAAQQRVVHPHRVVVVRKRAAPPRSLAHSPPRLLASVPPRFHRRFVPPLRARAAILVDARSGAVLWARRPHARLPIASTTKLMTGVLALERLAPQERVAVPKGVLRIPLVREGLRPGEKVQTRKLLIGLLVFSGNDDAATLADAVAGSRGAFVRLMNRRAHELGLRDTHFSNPSGVIDRGNRSSAADLAALARYAMRDRRFRAIVRTRIARVKWHAPTYEKVYVNKNPLLFSYRGADGVKTGWTTVARHCIVASAHRHGVRLIAVVLGSNDAMGVARRLLDFGFDRRR